MEMLVEKNENELFYGNQKNISSCIWDAWFEIKETTLNVDSNEIRLIAATLSTLLIGLLMIYIFYVPVYWMKNLTDVGYNTVKGKSKQDRMKSINRIRRLRKEGNNVPPPFPNGWFAIAETKDVAAGKAISVDCLGQNFVVFRSQEGESFVLDAYCSHMGANLGVGGLVRGNCVECPFHQWKFSGLDGSVADIPYSKSVCDVSKNGKIKKWISFETNGLIFIWHHAENEEPWKIPVVKEIESGEWVFQGKNEFFINSHIQDIPENGADVAHLESVHGPIMTTGSDLRFSRTKLSSLFSHVWDAKWTPNDVNKHIATINLKQELRIFGKISLFTIDVFIQQIGPGYVQLLIQTPFGPLSILQTVTPTEPLVQRMAHTFYAPRYMAPILKFVFLGESIMVERDIMVWNHKMFINNPILVKEDKLIKAFRNWYSQFYSANSISFLAAKSDLSW